jgi:hypothetical protein
MSRVREVLTAARGCIDSPNLWTKRCYAKDPYGKGVDARHWTAVCFCIMGAIQRQCDLKTAEGRALYAEVLDELRSHLPSRRSTISSFNDSSTHDDVLNLFDKALAA